MTDDGETTPNFKPIESSSETIAIAIKDDSSNKKTPQITAAAKGALAEKILK